MTSRTIRGGIFGLTFMAALTVSCAYSGFGIEFCEDEAGQVRHCECTKGARESGKKEMSPFRFRNYMKANARGDWERVSELEPSPPFILRGRWFVIVSSDRRERTSDRRERTTARAWLQCDNDVIQGKAAYRGSVLYSSGARDWEFLVYFPLPPESGFHEAPLCRMHVDRWDADGRALKKRSTTVYAVSSTMTVAPDHRDSTWTVIPDPGSEDLTKLRPISPAPEPRLCRPF